MYGLQTAPSPRRANCKIQRNIKYKEDRQMYGLQTAPSPRRANCKIQRNIKYKEDNFGGEKFWMKI